MITGTISTFTANNAAISGNVFAAGTNVQVKAEAQATIPAAGAGIPASYDLTVTLKVKNATGNTCVTSEAPVAQNVAVQQQQQTVTVAPPSVLNFNATSFYFAEATLTAQGRDAQGNLVGARVTLAYRNGGFQIGAPNDLFPLMVSACSAANAPVQGCLVPVPAPNETVTVPGGAALTPKGGYVFKIAGQSGTNKRISVERKIAIDGPVKASAVSTDQFTKPTEEVGYQPVTFTPKAGNYTATLTVKTEVDATPQPDPACKSTLLSAEFSWQFTVQQESSSSSMSSESSESPMSSSSSSDHESSSSSESLESFSSEAFSSSSSSGE